MLPCVVWGSGAPLSTCWHICQTWLEYSSSGDGSELLRMGLCLNGSGHFNYDNWQMPFLQDTSVFETDIKDICFFFWVGVCCLISTFLEFCIYNIKRWTVVELKKKHLCDCADLANKSHFQIPLVKRFNNRPQSVYPAHLASRYSPGSPVDHWSIRYCFMCSHR